MPLPPHESDLAMSQLIQITQGEFGRTSMVQQNIGHPLDLSMPGDGDNRERQLFLQNRIDRYKAFDGTVHQHAWILFDQIGLTTMAGGEVKVSLFDQYFFDSIQNQY